MVKRSGSHDENRQCDAARMSTTSTGNNGIAISAALHTKSGQSVISELFISVVQQASSIS